ncbi:hypothetical protein A7985_25060 [Pseudoalteromonas luteoviolacea]|uniref:SMODS-associated and fused to various effectors domain-containing protein n=1 Tax=Pseudoalteromonas luteoviolacea TaxID=43657 RepID=A0A1C0TIQ1_9GAMM|nr:SAVED domain-containing protein [Pseudoalteromonas luteoviolacea]OCQ17949.1 hypothetical protein A7985_25060 [Pseudoalteromonas luteoviolacea]
MKDVILDFLYVIAQRRLSAARKLMQVGLAVAVAALGVGSLVFSMSYNGIVLTADTKGSAVAPFLINILLVIGELALVSGIALEVYQQFFGEGSSAKRAKSIDLRSLSKGSAPKLSTEFSNTIEASGTRESLFLQQKTDESLEDWLDRSTQALTNFAQTELVELNQHESEHPLAIGAIAHIPHCFTLGFLVANRRLVNYYCWDRDSKKEEKSRWVDTRDKRTRGQSTSEGIKHFLSERIDDEKEVKRLGLSIELSIKSDPEVFLEKTELDAVCQIKLPKQYIGNLFSEKEQVKIISEIRDLINNQLLKKYSNVEELHITITAQNSFIIRFAADLNQNHIPSSIKIYHFENNSYPWCFNLSPNCDELSFTVFKSN